MDKKQEIIQEIQRIANKVSPRPITQEDFKKESIIPFGTLRYQFGTFSNAIVAAGLKPNPQGIPISGYKKLSDNDLLKEIARLWDLTGYRPTESILNSKGNFSTRPYRKRWGSFNNAVDEFINNNPEIQSKYISQNESDSISNKLQNPIVIPRTHKPKSSITKKRLLYGEPLDFRGLRYAPVNEQGVFYLFGMVSRELGFLIESIRTDYPDCEGKRCTDTNGSVWEHVRIEFEYRSSNYFEHGHNSDDCDLIVCWIHDWDECPIEVLELKAELKKLIHK